MTKTKNIAFFLILMFTTMAVSAHQDFWVTTEFGNIKTRIKTGYKYEEIKKVEIIGKLAELLAKKLNYNEPILLDFNHFYVGIAEPIYFLSFDNGTIQYNNSYARKGQALLNKKGIVVRQVSNKFDIINTLKMLEYSIINWKTIKKEQKKIEYNDNYCDWIINSIDSTKTVEILNHNVSEIISELKKKKIYRPDKDFNSGITYFWQNDKYNIVFVEKGKETIITLLTNIYDIQRKWNTVFIFETSADFIVFDTYKKEIVSKKWTIENADKNYRLYDINHIGGDKYSISFFYYSEEAGIQPKNQILIYARHDDKLIQDLNKLMKE
ncbi:hypothetical protein [Winogradskyella pulchriflava]|uniref:Uncharacterized protein n=1 Tax=Winogradskyella pulchriflava TaxID=1110688 RepID=A0ABV6QEM6_9FLAO